MSIVYKPTPYNGFGVESVPTVLSTTVEANVHTVNFLLLHDHCVAGLQGCDQGYDYQIIRTLCFMY